MFFSEVKKRAAAMCSRFRPTALPDRAAPYAGRALGENDPVAQAEGQNVVLDREGAESDGAFDPDVALRRRANFSFILTT